MTLNGAKTINTITRAHNLIANFGRTLGVKLDAFSTYTPTVGDVLVKRQDQSSKHDKFDYDFRSYSAIVALVSSIAQLANTLPIDQETLEVTKTNGSAISVSLTAG